MYVTLSAEQMGINSFAPFMAFAGGKHNCRIDHKIAFSTLRSSIYSKDDKNDRTALN